MHYSINAYSYIYVLYMLYELFNSFPDKLPHNTWISFRDITKRHNELCDRVKVAVLQYRVKSQTNNSIYLT